MEIPSSLFNALSRDKKRAIRLLDVQLRNWEARIHREARMANAMLQKRQRDPHDRMTSGAVVAKFSYWSRSIEAESCPVFSEPMAKRRYNCTMIGEDDPFGMLCRLTRDGSSPRLTGYYLGPMPCCFLLHDLCLSIANLDPSFDLDALLRIAEVQCDLQIRVRFIDEIPEAGQAGQKCHLV